MHLSGIRRAAQERFATFLPDVIDEDMLPALARFASDIPWRYVRTQTVDDALTLLERDHRRTHDALRARRDVVARGVDGLLAPSQIWSREDSLYEGSFTDAAVLLLEFHPEYLRVVEHVYGNLACLYWSIVKKRGVDGRFDLPGAVAVLGDQGLSMLTVGYDEVIRNAALMACLGGACYDVFLNERVYWRCVPARVWTYTIGGYQVIKKWLSYRERPLLGRDLKPDEARYVTEMTRRIAAILPLEPALDENYARVKADTYDWPQAGSSSRQ